ncbi:MAG: hypothetical protein RL095_3083 [Verrucomicrobiota bacterium]|jgi:uncharacterized protein (DUF58 family)
MAKPSPSPLLDVETLERFSNLMIFARSTVDGYFAGRHKARGYGSSAQFRDYQAYEPGMDPSRIDWRLYARNRRLYSRRFDNETDMSIHLLVDCSASMAYPKQGESKYSLGAKVAAALAYLSIRQGDKVSLTTFGEGLRDFHQPGGTRQHLMAMLNSLEHAAPQGKTSLTEALHQAHGLLSRRGRLVIISDFQHRSPDFLEALSLFQHRSFDILLLRVLAEDELELPLSGPVRFQDMETGDEIIAEPAEISAAYAKLAAEDTAKLAAECANRGIQHHLLPSTLPWITAIESFLGVKK